MDLITQNPEKIQIPSAVLYPLRKTKYDLEVLLGRRAFWNALEHKPMKYPGEWAAIGGVQEKDDKSLMDTALREFREETSYFGKFYNVILLRSGCEKSHGDVYYIESYAAGIGDITDFIFQQNAELIDARWMRPDKWIAVINSKDFWTEQKRKIHELKLDNPEYGIHAIKNREYPHQTFRTLKVILHNMPKLLNRY